MDPQDTQPQEDITSTPEITSPPEKKKNTLYVEILLEAGIVLILIAILVSIFAYFKIISFPSFSSSPLPLDPTGKEIVAAGINYNIVSTIDTISTSPKTTTISLTSSGKPYPKFVITSDTKITKQDAGNVSSESLRLTLHAHERLAMAAVYDLKTKTWQVTQIFLYD